MEKWSVQFHISNLTIPLICIIQDFNGFSFSTCASPVSDGAYSPFEQVVPPSAADENALQMFFTEYFQQQYIYQAPLPLSAHSSLSSLDWIADDSDTPVLTQSFDFSSSMMSVKLSFIPMNS
jgi:hypothetical protein